MTNTVSAREKALRKRQYKSFYGKEFPDNKLNEMVDSWAELTNKMLNMCVYNPIERKTENRYEIIPKDDRWTGCRKRRKKRNCVVKSMALVGEPKIEEGYNIYINGNFYCFKPTWSEATTEIENYEREAQRK